MARPPAGGGQRPPAASTQGRARGRLSGCVSVFLVPTHAFSHASAWPSSFSDLALERLYHGRPVYQQTRRRPTCEERDASCFCHPPGALSSRALYYYCTAHPGAAQAALGRLFLWQEAPLHFAPPPFMPFKSPSACCLLQMPSGHVLTVSYNHRLSCASAF
jgi:hypothetical protein